MNRLILMCSLAVVAACASQSQAPVAHEVGIPTASRFASPELCEQVVSNVEKNEQQSTTTPVSRKGFFNSTAYNELHRDRVRRCTTSLSEKEALCIAEAPSLQYVRECRKFALVR